MARTQTMASIDAQIKKAQESVEKTKARYDAAITELGALYDRKKALQIQELASALEKSEKTYEDVLKFIKNGKF
ncbi:MAG: ErpK protein [Spirochaetia bacterium]|nr:ErpK protein [Spirochaetia bacterium]